MAPRVRLRPALLPDARTLAEVLFLAPWEFPLSATEPRPQANSPNYYDSSSRLLFSPAFLSSHLKKSNAHYCDCGNRTALGRPSWPTSKSKIGRASCRETMYISVVAV